MVNFGSEAASFRVLHTPVATTSPTVQDHSGAWRNGTSFFGLDDRECVIPAAHDAMERLAAHAPHAVNGFDGMPLPGRGFLKLSGEDDQRRQTYPWPREQPRNGNPIPRILCRERSISSRPKARGSDVAHTRDACLRSLHLLVLWDTLRSACDGGDAGTLSPLGQYRIPGSV